MVNIEKQEPNGKDRKAPKEIGEKRTKQQGDTNSIPVKIKQPKKENSSEPEIIANKTVPKSKKNKSNSENEVQITTTTKINPFEEAVKNKDKKRKKSDSDDKDEGQPKSKKTKGSNSFRSCCNQRK